MGRHRLLPRNDERHAIHRLRCRRSVQDRSVAEARTCPSARCRSTFGVAKQSTYIMPDDWFFASRRHRGRHPFWGQAILRKYVRPVAEKVGIQKCIGWHTFRHTYSTLLRSVGTEFKVLQELQRHSSLRSTLDVYTQAISPAKHAAQEAVLSLVFSHEASGASQSPANAAA